MDESHNALDALFLRAAKHPEVRIELCAALLGAELYTLTPRGQSTRAAESVARPQGRNLQFMRWGQEGKEYYFVFTSARMARKGLTQISKSSRHAMVIIAMPGRELLVRMQVRGVGIAV